jgi:hypothetical protein
MKKPVAYMSRSGVLFKVEPDAPIELTPLYKALTDEEILELAKEIEERKKDATKL